MKNPTKAQAKEINAKLQKAYADSKPKNAAPSRTWMNSATIGNYAGINMVCARDNAGQKSINGRVA